MKKERKKTNKKKNKLKMYNKQPTLFVIIEQKVWQSN